MILSKATRYTIRTAYGHGAEVDNVRRILDGALNAYTLIEGDGFWTGAGHRVYREPSATIVVVVFNVTSAFKLLPDQEHRLQHGIIEPLPLADECIHHIIIAINDANDQACSLVEREEIDAALLS